MAGFLAMGGYGAYLWPGYALAIGLLLGLWLLAERRCRRARRALAAAEEAERKR